MWGCWRGHSWTGPGHGAAVGEGTQDDLRTGVRGTGTARAPGAHSRVWAFFTLPHIWGLQFLHQDSDDENKHDEVHLRRGGAGGARLSGRRGKARCPAPWADGLTCPLGPCHPSIFTIL